jgi:excisionase family DNA binding protein
VTEAAEAVGLSKPTVWAEIRAGRLRVRRVGRRTLIPITAIYAWLQTDESPDVAA